MGTQAVFYFAAQFVAGYIRIDLGTGNRPLGPITLVFHQDLLSHRLSDNKKAGHPKGWPAVNFMSGGDLLSHVVSHAVPSALKGLASGFGMEPGVSPSL